MTRFSRELSERTFFQSQGPLSVAKNPNRETNGINIVRLSCKCPVVLQLLSGESLQELRASSTGSQGAVASRNDVIIRNVHTNNCLGPSRLFLDFWRDKTFQETRQGWWHSGGIHRCVPRRVAN